jgi:cytochrome P450
MAAKGEGPVTVTAPDGVYYDPYDVQINADPSLAFRGLRDEAPLYYNEQHDFYALSRFADVDRAIVDHETFSSARGAIIELIKANIDMPPGVLIFEDPPIHDVHRKLLRFEPPAPHVARYVTRDVTYYGQTVPEGSAMMMLIGAANRDHRQFPPDGDVFDIHREPRQHLAFSVGTHYCLGSALARLEGRIALEEILTRFPEWDVDLSSATLCPTSTVRGWEAMPAVLG